MQGVSFYVLFCFGFLQLRPASTVKNMDIIAQDSDTALAQVVAAK
jgi:hypothetical protein